jgi:hypothetical protein
MQVTEFQKARIVTESEQMSKVTLASSMTVSAEAAANNSGIYYYSAAVEGTKYPALAAVWENEEDAIFDNL